MRYKAKKKFPFFSILLIIFFSLLIYFFFFSNAFQVKTIRVDPSYSELIEKNIIRDFGFFELNNIFLINKKNIGKELNNIVKINSFSIKRNFLNTLEVEIKEREEVLVCCFENNCFKIDKEGIAFEKTIKNDYLSCPYLELKDKITEKENIESILMVKKELEGFLGKLILENNSLTLETNEGWHIYFTFKNNISSQLLRLNILLEEIIKETKNLDYIDLKYGEKVYFR